MYLWNKSTIVTCVVYTVVVMGTVTIAARYGMCRFSLHGDSQQLNNTLEPCYSGHLGECEVVLINGVFRCTWHVLLCNDGCI